MCIIKSLVCLLAVEQVTGDESLLQYPEKALDYANDATRYRWAAMYRFATHGIATEIAAFSYRLTYGFPLKEPFR